MKPARPYSGRVWNVGPRPSPLHGDLLIRGRASSHVRGQFEILRQRADVFGRIYATVLQFGNQSIDNLVHTIGKSNGCPFQPVQRTSVQVFRELVGDCCGRPDEVGTRGQMLHELSHSKSAFLSELTPFLRSIEVVRCCSSRRDCGSASGWSVALRKGAVQVEIGKITTPDLFDERSGATV